MRHCSFCPVSTLLKFPRKSSNIHHISLMAVFMPFAQPHLNQNLTTLALKPLSVRFYLHEIQKSSYQSHLTLNNTNSGRIKPDLVG